ncbi:hypothetical protein Aduo_005744 [Ancylostoma duodenale]
MSQTKDRRTRKRETVVNTSENNPASRSSDLTAGNISEDLVDYSQMPLSDIINSILAKINDPEVVRMVQAIDQRLSKGFSEHVEEEKRSRSLVISGLPEPPSSASRSEKLNDLESTVDAVLDILKVECRPVEAYRMGNVVDGRPRLVKLVMPSRSHWARALSNARLLRNS